MIFVAISAAILIIIALVLFDVVSFAAKHDDMCGHHSPTYLLSSIVLGADWRPIRKKPNGTCTSTFGAGQ